MVKGKWKGGLGVSYKQKTTRRRPNYQPELKLWEQKEGDKSSQPSCEIEMTTRKQELRFTDDTISEIGDQIIDRVIENLSDYIESGVRHGLIPNHLARDIAEYILQSEEADKSEEASFAKLEITFLKARGQLHKRVREYVYKKLPKALGRHGEQHYGVEPDTE